MLISVPNQHQERGPEERQQEEKQEQEAGSQEQQQPQQAGTRPMSRAGSISRLQLFQSPVVECPYTLDWEGTPSEDRLVAALGLSHALAKARALQESGV